MTNSKKNTTSRKRTTKKSVKKTLGGKITGAFRGYDRGPLPQMKNAVLKYAETVELTTGTTGLFGTQQVWQLASLFDPNYTGTGHQPYGFDQLAAEYRRYRVNAVKVQLIFTDPGSDGLVAGAGLMASGFSNNLAGQSVDAIKERPNCQTRTVNASGKQYVIMNFYADLARIEGISKKQYAGDMSSYSAPINQSPSQSPSIVTAVGSDRGASGITVMCRITIKYYAQFYHRIIQSQS